MDLKRNTSNFPGALITSELDYSPNRVVVISAYYIITIMNIEIYSVMVISIHGDVLLSEYLETKFKIV